MYTLVQIYTLLYKKYIYTQPVSPYHPNICYHKTQIFFPICPPHNRQPNKTHKIDLNKINPKTLNNKSQFQKNPTQQYQKNPTRQHQNNPTRQFHRNGVPVAVPALIAARLPLPICPELRTRYSSFFLFSPSRRISQFLSLLLVSLLKSFLNLWLL